MSADQRRAEIAAAAREIALAEGLDAVTLRAVASASAWRPGWSPTTSRAWTTWSPTPSRHRRRAELAEVAALLSTVDAPAARIGCCWRRFSTARHDVTPRLGAGVGARRPRRDARRAGARGDGRLAAVLAAEVERGMDAGVFAVGDADAIAWHLLAIIDGLNAHSLVRWDGQPDRRGLVQRASPGCWASPRAAARALVAPGQLCRPLDRHRPAEHVLGGAVARARRGGDGRGIIRPRGLAGEVQHPPMGVASASWSDVSDPTVM
jgi:AcrR family transcriptional regulator